METSLSTPPPDSGEGSSGNTKVAQKGINWYFSKKEIEENSPSRQDGIDLERENCLRNSYSAYLQRMTPLLNAPRRVTATAIIFCHRFFLRQSHAKNDWKLVATSCMFLAAKVEDHRYALEDVIQASYKLTHPRRRGPDAPETVTAEEFYEQQRDLVLKAEMLVLTTLNYELQVDQPYDILVSVAGRFDVDKSFLIAVAETMVDAGLETSMWLQFKPTELAVGAIVIAGCFSNFDLHIDGQKAWWQMFHVTTIQVVEFFDQLMEYYKQSIEVPNQQTEVKASGADEEPVLMRIYLIQNEREIRDSILSSEEVWILDTPYCDDFDNVK